MLRTTLVALLLASAIASAQPTPGDAPTVELSSDQAVPGEVVVLEARLQTGGANVGAVQVDLTFDSVNTPVTGVSTGVPDCSISPDLDKQFLAVFRPMSCTDTACNMVRTFVFPNSFPITPIADGATLYTCRFAVQSEAPLGVYPVTLSSLVVGDVNGVTVAGAVGSDGSIVVVAPTPTPTTTPTPSMTATPTRTATATATATPTVVPCIGDCNRDGEVTIDELILAVSIALGSGNPSACLPADANGDGELTIDELIAAVSRALNGCA